MLDALTLTMAERPEWLAGWFLALVASAALCLAGMIWLLWRRRQDRATESALREELDARDRQLRDSEQVRALHEQEVEHLQTALEEQKARSGQLEQSIEHWRQQSAALENRLAALASELTAKQDRVAQLASESSQYQQRAETLSEELGQLKVELREQQVTLDKERRSASEKLELLEKNRDALKQEFENLANRIFEQKSERFSQQSKTSLDSLLNPFRDQLQDFRKRVEDVYTTETRDRQALRSEIKSLQELNRQITEEAANLTRALKGDKKIQGNWGELILERVLERSGLRKGVEYETQGSYRDEDNQLLRPDVIVHLHLVDTKQVVFHWIFSSTNVRRGLVQFGKRRIERRRLSGTGGAGDENHAVRLVNCTFEVSQNLFFESELGHVKLEVRLVQQPHNDLLTPQNRKDGHTKVHHLTPSHLHLDATILWQTTLCNIEVGHDLQTRDDRIFQFHPRRNFRRKSSFPVRVDRVRRH